MIVRVILVVMLLHTPVWAQATGDDEPPSLDELLGLEDASPQRSADRSLPDTNENELERKLAGEEVGEAFVDAVRLMEEAAQRLRAAGDTGIDTQRAQEEILRKLDQIIESAQQGQSSSSSSSSDSQQNQPDQQQQQQNNQQSSSNSEENTDAPAEQEGRLLPQGAANAAAWGQLRARLRDALVQGLNDPFSSMYRSMTEEYYKRLAEGNRR